LEEAGRCVPTHGEEDATLPQDPKAVETRPLVDTTARVDPPTDVFALLVDQPGISLPEKLTLILADQRSRWLAGSPVPTERYLDALPELAAEPGARLALVAGEVRARRESGMVTTREDFLARFPDLADQLTGMFSPAGEGTTADSLGPVASDDLTTEPYEWAGTARAREERTTQEFIDRYRILRILGRGGFGLVYLARDELLERLVAIKVPRLERVTRDQDIDNFLNEARTLASLDHEHIVPVYDVGRTVDGLCFVVSKWIDGVSLTRAALRGRADYARAATLIAAVADALDHSHRRGLVHRDVKPSNVLIDAAGKPYLADFGLALREEDFGRGSALAGTPAYMSPEQARGEGHRVDGRTDIFSLGIILYELMSGRHPFGAGEPSTIMRRIASEEPVPPRTIDSGIPQELERICLRALAPQASDRYSTAREMADDLVLFAAQAGGGQAPDRDGDEDAGSPMEGDRAGGLPSAPVVRVVPKGLRSFGSDDADFFLELLHGPRDRDGLPDSVRFWKTQIEAQDSFPVGLIYGPSGCGKSSLVKAGLLPRLASRVVRVYEGATSDLESRLLARVRKACPGIEPETSLAVALADIRRGVVLPRGSKLLIVLDQFEQWLHARGNDPEDGLIRALRQCDGERVQALFIVRVDFWMAASRFMRQLEVRVVEGENAAPVDLFPPVHARKVLSSFGAAYGALPASPAEFSDEQRSFIERAVEIMTQDGSVTPVRLALFAEMVKGRAWTTETLDGLGGELGIGVRFLDQTFIEASAPPGHRHILDAARRVLSALLPGPGANIKGHVRSHGELLDASGYRDDPARFDSLMRILDEETRLLTPIAPIDPEDGVPTGPGHDRTGTTTPPGERNYQLTHDYLVPAIREWLARQQRETGRGRSELKLAERASLWGAKPERKQLPSLAEWASIRLLTDPGTWTPTQRAMMRAAARSHLARAGGLVMFLVALGLNTLFVRRGIEEDRSRAHADDLVRRLLDADSPQVPSIVKELDGYRPWANPGLRSVVVDSSTRPLPRLHARIALHPVDSGQVQPLFRAMLEADPAQFLIIRDALSPRQGELIPLLWHAAESAERPPDAAFRAAVSLAAYDPDNGRWADRAAPVARQLARQPSLLVPAWVDLLRPVRGHLVPALAGLLRDRSEDNPLVASILASYASDRPEVVADAIGDAGPGEFLVLLDLMSRLGPPAPEALDRVLARLLDEYKAEPRDPTDVRIANTAIALIRLGRADRAWPLLKAGPDPCIRSHLIDRMAPLRCDPSSLVDRLRREGESSVRAALLLGLGRFGTDQLPDRLRSELAEEVLASYRDDSDPEVHAASGWLLRAWGRADRLRAVEAGLAAGRVEGGRRWYVGSQGMAMVVLPGRDGFQMGSTDGEPWRKNNETRRIVRIRPFDIASTEVTIGQFRAFLDTRPDLVARYAKFEHSDPNLPQTEVSWYDSAAYCNWLSEREGLPREQRCYEPNEDGKYAAGMSIPADFLSRTGYHLPLESEWEYACRAGTTTSRSFGASDKLISRYACCQENSMDQPIAVGSLLPNGFGLFDMHGNVFEWCHDGYLGDEGHEPDTDEVLSDTDDRLVRGSGFMSQPRHVRSACRYKDLPVFRNDAGGFRVARGRPALGR
jgi:formylglycine-generating enzyme required for sulfatase activity